jgi:galactofuranose transport system ATP-binding protein
MPSAETELLSAQGISKQFPGVQALDGVNFSVRRGEIHALMGENGAGKSTLIKVLTGVYPRDGGTAVMNGNPIHPHSPKDAEAVGISTVYQEVNLIPHLSIAENISLGREPTRLGMIRWRTMAKRAAQALARLDLKLDVWQELASCSIAIQQMVAIARALDTSANLLILDEPTSSLDTNEVAELFGVMKRLRDQGMGIIFVTHFLDPTGSLSCATAGWLGRTRHPNCLVCS